MILRMLYPRARAVAEGGDSMADRREQEERLQRMGHPRSAVGRRGANGWVSGRGAAQKLFVWVSVMLFMFFASCFGTIALLTLVGFGDVSSLTSRFAPSEEGTIAAYTGPDIDLRISDARWEGGRPVVEGTWRGDVSSVHCDLFEGGGEGIATDWWDRGGRTRMDWSKRTFTQEFVEAKGREIEDPIDPEASYGVACWALFSNGGQMGDEAPVEGTPRR